MFAMLFSWPVVYDSKRFQITKVAFEVIQGRPRSINSYLRGVFWQSLVHGQVTIIFVVSVCLSVC